MTTTAAPTLSRSAAQLRLLPAPDALHCTLASDHICVVTDSGTPLTAALVQRLHAQGWRIVVLQFPHTLVQPCSDLSTTTPRVLLDNLCEQHLQQTFNSITTSYGPVGAFIHLHPPWNHNAYDDGIFFSESERCIVRHIFLMAKHLKHPLTAATRAGRSWFITVAHLDGQFGLGRTHNFSIVGGGLFGLTKTINLEWEQVFCRAIDIQPDLPIEQTVQAIDAELHDPNLLIIEVGYSRCGRATLVGKSRNESCGCQRHPGTDITPATPITDSSVFVVSGGARGITARCVVRMAQQYQCRFLLLGRTPRLDAEPVWASESTHEADLKRRFAEYSRTVQRREPNPGEVEASVKTVLASREIETTLQEVAHAGGHADYLCVDITDSAALQRSLPDMVRQVGPITGLIHGAGVLADKLIENKSIADFERVYAPKVSGLQHLLECLPTFQLDYIVLFSSVAGFYGNVGQADYALANETLNKAAHLIKRVYPDCRVIAFDWGPWDRGMVSPGLKHLFEQHQVTIIAADAGAQVLVDELENTADTVQVLVGSPITTTTNGRLDILLRMLRNRRAIMGTPHREETDNLHTYHIDRRLSLHTNPFVTDHTIGTNPVLPATCVMAWVANTCEQLYPGYTFFRCEQYHVLHGIFVEQTPRDYTLHLREVTKDTDAGVVVFEAIIWSEPQAGRRYHHYKGRFTLQQHIPPTPYDDNAPLYNTMLLPGTRLYQDGTLFHGRSFQGAVAIHSMSDAALGMQCRLPTLPEQMQGQFTIQLFNPYTTDVCGQSALILARCQFGKRSLPTRVGSFEQFSPIPFDTSYYVWLTVQTRTRHKLVVDLTVYECDTPGKVLACFASVEFMLMPALADHTANTPAIALPPPAPHSHWGPDAIGEFATGAIRNVFGDAYATIDSYSRRVRLPLPPYLFLDRVLTMTGERGRFAPCSITTEYTIPANLLYSIDGTIPWAVAVEAGQGILFLLGYLGVDLLCQGKRVYRHLDFTMVFLDALPRIGETLQYHIHLHSFIQRRDSMLLTYQFDCVVADRVVLQMTHSCAGFFSDSELQQGRGVIGELEAPEDHNDHQSVDPFVPPLICTKTSFDRDDLHALSRGELAVCFGETYNQYGTNPCLRLPPPHMLMLDRVCSVDTAGGARQRGALIAEKDITPDDWYFQCHFKGDPVLPGSMLIDGCAQLVQFYLLFLGMQTCMSNASFQPIPGIKQRARFRAQIYPIHALLIYQMEIMDVGVTPQPYARAAVHLLFEDKVAATLNIGVQLSDQSNGT